MHTYIIWKKKSYVFLADVQFDVNYFSWKRKNCIIDIWKFWYVLFCIEFSIRAYVLV